MEKAKTKYYFIVALFSLLCLSMTCENDPYYYPAESKQRLTNLIDLTIYHVNNAGIEPYITSKKIKKEAYMMQIGLVLDSLRSSRYGDITLKDPIVGIKIYTECDFNETYHAGDEISSCFNNFPLSYFDSLEDITLKGDTLSYLNNTFIYKVLLTDPLPNTFSFRVDVHLESETIISKVSTPIELY